MPSKYNGIQAMLREGSIDHMSHMNKFTSLHVLRVRNTKMLHYKNAPFQNHLTNVY